MALARKKVRLDVATAHASGGQSETEGGYSYSTAQGSKKLGDKDYEILSKAAWLRGRMIREYELNDMQRTIDTYTQYVEQAEKQVEVAKAREQVAFRSLLVANLRSMQADERLRFAERKTFTADLWGALGRQMQDIKRTHLRRAVEVSFLMQAAYNFETDGDLNVIRTNYAGTSGLKGLSAGDSLMEDIDYFSYHFATQTKSKELPLKTLISLGSSFPFSMYQFRRTGVARFETSPEWFDLKYPGTFMRKLTAVEVVVEGLVGAEGVTGSIKNSGVSVTRTGTGGERLRLQPRETAFLSNYSVKGDAMIFRPSQETRSVFEGTGVATAWTVEIPPESNDLNYEAVSDIKIILYYTAFHDEFLERTLRSNLPKTGEWSRGFSLRDGFPDAFFLLLERGETSLIIRHGDFPYQHAEPRITHFAIYFLFGDASTQRVMFTLENVTARRQVTLTTGPEGIASSDATNPDADLNVFHGDSPKGEWQLKLDESNNPELFEQEGERSRIIGVSDIILFIDYDFVVRKNVVNPI